MLPWKATVWPLAVARIVTLPGPVAPTLPAKVVPSLSSIVKAPTWSTLPLTAIAPVAPPSRSSAKSPPAIEPTWIAPPPDCRLALSVSVTAPSVIAVSVVCTAPATFTRFVPLFSPPVNVVLSPAALPSVSPPLLSNVVAASTVVTLPVNDTA